MTELLQEEWKNWFGGKPPMPKGTQCDTILRNGHMFKGCKVGSYGASCWHHFGHAGDIVKYREIKRSSS